MLAAAAAGQAPDGQALGVPVGACEGRAWGPGRRRRTGCRGVVLQGGGRAGPRPDARGRVDVDGVVHHRDHQDRARGGGEELVVYFRRRGGEFAEVFLEGQAEVVYEGKTWEERE